MTALSLRRFVSCPVHRDVSGERSLINLDAVGSGTGQLIPETNMPVGSCGQNIAADAGDVLFGKLRPYLAKSYLVAKPVFASSEFLCLRPDTTQADPRWLLYVTLSQTWTDWATATSYGTKMPRTSWDQVADFRVGLPRLPEQRRIADFLDHQVARIYHIISLQSKQADLVNERRSAMLADVFAVNGASVPLRRIVSKWIDYRGATPDKTSSGTLLITAKNIRDGRITFETSREYIADEDYRPWMRRGLPLPGDVLLTTEAPLGEVAQIVEESMALAQRVILLRVRATHVVPRWLYWFLRSPQGTRELRSRATGTTAQGIKAERLREVSIPLPSKEKQADRLAPVEDFEKTWHALAPTLRCSINLLEERKRALITAAVTGEFDVSTASSRAGDAAMAGV